MDAERPGGRTRSSRFRDPWVRFTLVFAVLAMGSEVLYYGVIQGSAGLDLYLRALARVAGGLLLIAGESTEVVGSQIWSDSFLVDIAPECDAIQLCAILSAAIVAFPTSLTRKLQGLLFGVGLLQVVNFVRLASLFYIGGHGSKHFQTAHEVLWPGGLILVTIAIWLVWARLAAGPDPEAPDAPSATAG